MDNINACIRDEKNDRSPNPRFMNVVTTLMHDRNLQSTQRRVNVNPMSASRGLENVPPNMRWKSLLNRRQSVMCMNVRRPSVGTLLMPQTPFSCYKQNLNLPSDLETDDSDFPDHKLVQKSNLIKHSSNVGTYDKPKTVQTTQSDK